MSYRIFIVAGDPSGERYAARLMAAWRKLEPEVEFLGIGGARMEAEGLRSLVPFQSVNVVGFWEVARQYRFFRRLLQRCEEALCDYRVRAVVLVDYPGFNLQLARRAARRGIPVYYYIAPQTWAWGKWRLQTLAEVVTLLVVAFPFEVELFQRAGVRCTFVGHPLMDEPQLANPPQSLDKRPFQIAFLPGSRPLELQRHLPLLRQTIAILRRAMPHATFSVALPPAMSPRWAFQSELWEYQPDPYALLANSRAGLVKVGTSTLEAALCGMPFAAFYRTSWLSYGIARMLVRLPSAVLVNLLLQKPIVPEFLQHQARPAVLARALLCLLETEVAQQQWEGFQELRSLLGKPGVAERAAELFVTELAERR